MLTWERIDVPTSKPSDRAKACHQAECENFSGVFDAKFSFCPSCGHRLSTLNPRDDLAEKIAGLIATNDEASHCLALDGSSEESGKWYNHEKDLAAFSRELPGVLLTLTCLGEDGLRWKVYAFNGKTQNVKGVVSYALPTVHLAQLKLDGLACRV